MKFTSVDSPPALGDQHPWGRLVYVLESKLHTDSKGLPNWETCSRLGIYLGHSTTHADSVTLVLNPGTGYVSPQYHLVFDDKFTTVSSMRDGSIPTNWKELVTNSSFSSTEEQFSLADVWLRENSLVPDDPESALLLPSASTRFPVSEGAPVERSLVSEGVLFAPGPSVASKGAWNVEGAQNVDFSPSDPPIASEGDSSLPLCSPDCERDALHMPLMVNLETVCLRRSSSSNF